MSRTTGRYVTLLFVASIGMAFCGPVVAQVKLWKTTSAGRALNLQGYARADRSCTGLDPPGITIEVPPEHGVVCLRRDKMKLDSVIENDLKHCLGHVISGFFVTYLPRRAYVGSDQVIYSVRFPTKEHMVQFDLQVLPYQPGAIAEPKDISDPIDEKAQMPGPIPACTVPVS
jgi:hypothetical protein